MDRTTRSVMATALFVPLVWTGAATAKPADPPTPKSTENAASAPAAPGRAPATASQPSSAVRPEESKPARPRRLDPDDDARRSVRGDPEAPGISNETEELRELRKFEDEAFPKNEHAVVRPVTPLREGAAPVPRSRPVGADAQPSELRTSPSASPVPKVKQTPPEWFTKLKMPDLPVRWDPKVQAYLDWFRNSRAGRAVMSRWLKRQGRYRPLIEVTARRMGLPRDIMYVAMIESGYEPTAVSRVGAVGMWQFMPRTGKVYGLEQEFWVDERRDPERATEAAMHFWRDLYTRFGSWHLALAGYHAGYVAILKSIADFNTNDYWELCRHENGLPHETTLYVPKALAAAIIGNNRQAFGFGDVTADPPVEFERVQVPKSTSLVALARAAGVKEGDLAALNPELRRHRTPPRSWNLRVPKGTAEKVARNFDVARKEHDKIETYVVRFGERLDDVAARYKIALKELRKLNGIEEAAEVRPGTTMLVPRRTSEELQKADAEREVEETVVAVPDKDVAVAGHERVFYRVREGDLLGDVARFFGVTLEDLARWNAVDITVKIQPGMVLQLFVPQAFDRKQVMLVEAGKVRVVTIGSQEYYDTRALLRGRNRVVYICRRGDNLAKIGRRFNLTVGQMARINQMPRGTDLKPGQRIVVYAPQRLAASPTAQARKAPPRGREPARHRVGEKQRSRR
jgi:membrane-bound lytic murein transglycosylase D